MNAECDIAQDLDAFHSGRQAEDRAGRAESRTEAKRSGRESDEIRSQRVR